MREILFKGKRKDNGEWIESCNINTQYDMHGEKHIYIGLYFENNYYPLQKNIEWIEVDPKTVSEYSTLTDKNGTKIFEGDILRPFDDEIVVVSWIDHYSHLGLKVYLTNTVKKRGKEITETCEGMALLWDYDLDKIEVIGNIHDNPEIVKGE